MILKWTEYPNEADRKAGRNGTPRQRQELAAAPGGWKWAVILGGTIAKLHRAGDQVWSLTEENQ